MSRDLNQQQQMLTQDLRVGRTVQEIRDTRLQNLPEVPGGVDLNQLRRELRAGGNAGRGQDTNGQDGRGNYFSATGTNVWSGGNVGRVGGGYGYGGAQYMEDDPKAVQSNNEPLMAVLGMLSQSQNPAAGLAAQQIQQYMQAQVVDSSLAAMFDRGKDGTALKKALLMAQSAINPADAGYFDMAIGSLNSNGAFNLTFAEANKFAVGTNNLMRLNEQQNGNQVASTGFNGGGLGGVNGPNISGTNMNTYNTGPSRGATVANQWLGAAGTGLAYLREGLKIRDEFRGPAKTVADNKSKPQATPRGEPPAGMELNSDGTFVPKGEAT